MSQADYFVPDPYVTGAWLVRKDGADQSWIDPTDPTRLEFDYMKRISWLIETWADEHGYGESGRLRVVHIGGAGMSLARWLAVTRPTSPQIVLEPDADLTEAVRAIAPLPSRSGIKVRPVDGRAGLAVMPDSYAQVVILDAFQNGQVPAELIQPSAMTEIRRVLSDDGLLTINLVDSHPHAWARRVLATVMKEFTITCLIGEPSLMKSHRVTNLVVGASLKDFSVNQLARRAARAAFPCQVLADDELSRWLGGARPFSDADAVSSPPRAEADLRWFS